MGVVTSGALGGRVLPALWHSGHVAEILTSREMEINQTLEEFFLGVIVRMETWVIVHKVCSRNGWSPSSYLGSCPVSDPRLSYHGPHSF